MAKRIHVKSDSKPDLHLSSFWKNRTKRAPRQHPDDSYHGSENTGEGEEEDSESQLALQNEFLSSISHNIRTPMNAIVGYTELALNNVKDPVAVENYLRKVKASSDHLMALIDDMFAVRQLEKGEVVLSEIPCSISDIMYELNTMIIEQTEAKNQGLRFDISKVHEDNVYCDRSRLIQIMINLLSNAVKFTPEKGDIHVTVSQKDGAPAGTGSYEIRVKDTGIGMAPEFAAKAFEPFEKENASSGQNIGLGMTITKSLVDLMHGSIDLITVPNKGTEFILRLNFRLQQNQQKSIRKNSYNFFENPETTQSEEPKQIRFEGKRILLVDDVSINRDLARALLEAHDFMVEEAEDGEVAVGMAILQNQSTLKI